MDFGREEPKQWGQDLWARIDQAVSYEAERTKVAAKFLPWKGPLPEALTVPADRIILDKEISDGEFKPAEPAETLTVDEGSVTAIIELWVEFALTQGQVEGEEHLSTAVTLATRATNILSQAEDLLIFQGQEGTEAKLFNRVHRRRTNQIGLGLLDAVPDNHILPVKPVDAHQKKYGEHTFAEVARGYSLLQKNGHYGPYALVLHADVYADTYAPLENTLIMPADRIKPLVNDMFYGTGTLRPSTGLLMSLGGNTMDRVIAINPTTLDVSLLLKYIPTVHSCASKRIGAFPFPS